MVLSVILYLFHFYCTYNNCVTKENITYTYMVSIFGGTEDSARLACLQLLIYNVRRKTV